MAAGGIVAPGGPVALRLQMVFRPTLGALSLTAPGATAGNYRPADPAAGVFHPLCPGRSAFRCRPPGAGCLSVIAGRAAFTLYREPGRAGYIRRRAAALAGP